MQEKKIPILEEFYSIQGEGANTGKPTYFVRLGGCDLACRWCDSKESWNPENSNYKNIQDIINNAKTTKTNSILVTGGEPLIYNFDDFCTLASQNGFYLLLETSGAHDLSGKWNWICISPKKQKKPQDIFFEIANELKIIVAEEDDLIWAETCRKKVKNKNMAFYLQPEWSQFEKTKEIVIDYIKNNPQWNMSLQVHKFLNIP